MIRYTLAHGGTHGIEEKVRHFARVRPTTGRDYNKLRVPFSKYNTAIDTRTKFEQIPARDTVFPFLLFAPFLSFSLVTGRDLVSVFAPLLRLESWIPERYFSLEMSLYII